MDGVPDLRDHNSFSLPLSIWTSFDDFEPKAPYKTCHNHNNKIKKVRTTLKCSISHKFIQNLPFQSFYWQSVPLEFRLNTIFPLFDKLAWTPSLHMLLSKIKFKIFMWILGWPPPSYLTNVLNFFLFSFWWHPLDVGQSKSWAEYLWALVIWRHSNEAWTVRE